MIGVIAEPSEHAVVTELFELFKTPWEFYRSGRHYDVLLCAGDGEIPETDTKLLVIYAGRAVSFDAEKKIGLAWRERGARLLAYKALRIPLYEESVCFRSGADILVDEVTRQPVMHLGRSRMRTVARIGYYLFREVDTLLRHGQPPANAAIPTLELHIALLRDLILASGVRLVEIPPVPSGYRFLACLTHDVDHASLRRHRFDHTMLGFLYRAVIGSVVRVCRGRLPLRRLMTNWAAALKLPLVHFGLARDCWSNFDAYTKLERGVRSTFFVIPFKNRPGRNGRGTAPRRRASRYGAADIAAQIQTLKAAGCEIALHGVDAWRDSSSGREELNEIRRLTGLRNIGVRTHWLYFDEQSPRTLEKADADYDSTVGYNETVGYRAGTTQAYKPLQAVRLLELPLHIMDTALFFPGHLDLSPEEASTIVGRIVDNAAQFGGCVTVNWHDRSILPERLWGDFYVDLIDDLKCKGAWFSTAAQAVSWFRKRRSASFETVDWEPHAVRVKLAVDGDDELPPLQLRVHTGQEWPPNATIDIAKPGSARDHGQTQTVDACVAFS